MYTSKQYENLANSRRKSREQLLCDCHRVHGNMYEYSKFDYINCMTKSIIICKIHGEFKQSMNHHLKGKGCPRCAADKTIGVVNKKRHDDNVINWANKCKIIHGDMYEYHDTYESCYQKMRINCKTCGHKFIQAAYSHLNGAGCPSCARSKGEKAIELWLKTFNIKHIAEHWFVDCRGICRPLPFDFWLPDHNILIEYQGKQHFECVYFSKKNENKELLEKNFIQTQNNDRIKKQYCIDNNITLVEITYKQLRQVSTILSKLINTNG